MINRKDGELRVTFDLERFTNLAKEPLGPGPDILTGQSDVLGGGIKKRIDYLTSHMFYQLKEHETAQKRTDEMFAQLLNQLEEVVVSFQESFISREMPAGNVYARIDSDRSVGILHLLWHTVSFTIRGNTTPMALHRKGRDPIFTGRIVALAGDYHKTVIELDSQEFPDLLDDEIASLYIPASPVQPAVMRFRHKNEELFFHQAEAPQQFLLKILEAICAGGVFHEENLV